MFRNIAEDATIEIYFETFSTAGAPTAPSSALTASDFAIYKNGSATAKTSTNGLTVTSPFNSEAGCHLLVIDTSVDTGDAGFWTTGGRYHVKFNTSKTVDSVSIDGVSVPRGSFGIQSEYMRGTDSALLAASYSAPPSASAISTQVNSDLTTAHGSGAWTTATGFATPVNVTDAVTSIKGADNDTLKTLSDQIDGIDSGGDAEQETSEEILALVETIASQTGQITGARLSVSGAVTPGGTIQLIKGKDYTNAASNGIARTIADAGAVIYGRLTSGTLAASKAFGASRENGDAVIAGTISSVTESAGVTTISIAIDSDQLPDTIDEADDYTYQIQRVTSDGDKVVEVSGRLSVSKRTV
jgi:hypothetical protein